MPQTYFWPPLNFNTTVGEKWPDRARDYRNEPNPFERGADGKIKSPDAISRAIRQDAAKARAQCKLAGESLAVWFPDNPR